MTYKGETPTQTFIFDEDFDLTTARNLYVTYSYMNQKKIFRKTGTQLEISGEHNNILSVDLSQEETLKLPDDYLVQINGTYGNGKRWETNIAHMETKDTLEPEVLP